MKAFRLLILTTTLAALNACERDRNGDTTGGGTGSKTHGTGSGPTTGTPAASPTSNSPGTGTSAKP